MFTQIETLWNQAYQHALGWEADPFAYADAKVAPLRARLRAVERAQQQHPNGHPTVGSRAGRQQHKVR